jgi:pimeloyl-ACP methyl ester carboxylesterase
MMKLLAGAATLAMSLVAGGAMAAPKPPIVLVHGAWEDSNVWGEVTPRLQKDGYKVVVVSLPGRPSSPAAPEKVSLDLYRDTVLRAVDSVKGPVVLVGHSFGGFPISAAAEAAPAKIRTLVYVAAYLPRDGQTLLELGNSDRDSHIGPALQIHKETGIITIAYDSRASLFASDGPPELKAAIPNLIVDEPLGPLVTAIHLTGERFGGVDKVYIHTANDVVVSPWLQAQMVAATPVRMELTIQSGHTPFLTRPDALVAAIEQAARAQADAAGPER